MSKIVGEINAEMMKTTEATQSLTDRMIQEIESLRQQLAAMTADRDRLLDVMCEIAGSKSLTATPTQFYQHLQRIASDATITNPEALAATADLENVRWRLCRNTYLVTRDFGRGRMFSATMGISMLLFGRTPRHRIY